MDWFERLTGFREESYDAVLLTRLGGGAFGNHDDWIHHAMRRALQMFAGFGLDVSLVSFGPPSRQLLQMAEDFA